jgi:ADP-ribosylglycohydrolase
MHQLDLHGDTFRDKVLGCWMGKNCGGTLGTPVEEAWGRAEPFDIWWYPELQSGGLPNDDLEMQLVWLTALEQVGPDLIAADLARYWLDHIGYNFDEYGLSKTNLRLGLEPPVSGAFNNWFVDCMGCPIRSEVWACIAPGQPRIAARYAYHDAVCDHAGGESVFGELFNVAIQSSAFVISDTERLLDIGMTYLPEDSATRRAVTAARQAFADGVDWKEARERVLTATPSPIAQYSPINLGFQVIGWLYGTDFGDAMCKTVNCGYDTDSSGGSIGSWLGIRAGISQLPEKWIEPFGTGLSTNESWGGVRHLTDGTTPIPTNIIELTDKIIVQAERVLRHHGVVITGGGIEIDDADLVADDSVRELWHRSPWRVDHVRRHLAVGVDYGGNAAIAAGRATNLELIVSNPHPDPITVQLKALAPGGWQCADPIAVELPAASEQRVGMAVTARDRTAIEQRNQLLITLDAAGYPAMDPVSVPLVGAQAWRVHRDSPATTLDDLGDRNRPSGDWTELSVDGNALPLAELLADGGPIFLQSFWEATAATEVRLGIDCTVGAAAWFNGTSLFAVPGPRRIRPSLGPAAEVSGVVTVHPGFNELVIRIDPPADGTTPEGHVVLATPDRLRNGITHLGRTRFPWD